ncbi:AAA family ATPase [candidate division WOR-3 bacterium RBG_13_43_14]|uniref:AAA family ATPase n=1 Tax=candidate division WOR-3 bacterium RBG_13_43_14 TaxID=1802590 RepID=A0A1F4U1I4_UNCW3|nr:MAG: AAA family ATPase [candidate division WOR-3 bacterium RBG_13_43_14]
MKKTDTEALRALSNSYNNLKSEIAKQIIGQSDVIEQVIISVFCNGHALIIGVPGLAKTMLVNTIAQILDLSFNRVQFTPDLMPTDITGTEVIEEDLTTGRRNFRFVKGPIFANVILADEINRAPPKTQSALLQAMQEYNVTYAGNNYQLPRPFFVLATQNPIEQEGTYPLPEAQLDRFMFTINIDYPDLKDEKEIVKITTSAYKAELNRIISASEIIELQSLIRRMPVADEVIDKTVKLVNHTRPNSVQNGTQVKKYVAWGAGPRASQYLILGAKAKAALDGRFAPEFSDVIAVTHPVLRHRIITNFSAEAEGISSDQIIEELIKDSKP